MPEGQEGSGDSLTGSSNNSVADTRDSVVDGGSGDENIQDDDLVPPMPESQDRLINDRMVSEQ